MFPERISDGETVSGSVCPKELKLQKNKKNFPERLDISIVFCKINSYGCFYNPLVGL